MDLQFSPAEQEFGQRVRDWLEEKLLRGVEGPPGGGRPGQRGSLRGAAGLGEGAARGRLGGTRWPRSAAGVPRRRTSGSSSRSSTRGPAARTGLATRANLIGPTILEFGTEAQKRRFIPRILARREHLVPGLFSEPESGSDLAGCAPRAELDGDEWVINGQKIWTSSAHGLEWMYVLCRTEPDKPKHGPLSILLLPHDDARHGGAPAPHHDGAAATSTRCSSPTCARPRSRSSGSGDGLADRAGHARARAGRRRPRLLDPVRRGASSRSWSSPGNGRPGRRGGSAGASPTWPSDCGSCATPTSGT